ncbi:MAG: hypothetical protein IPM72_01370 [Chitinophagaceae bacterium]|nr:hypothetical protein [Chitinophagaceae bacterium]
MEVAVTDIATGKIRYRTINETYEWYEEWVLIPAIAGAGPDWEIINAWQFNGPQKRIYFRPALP